MSTLYENDVIRTYAESLVNREIHYCVSSLIHSLAQSEEAQRGLEIESDDLYPILSRDDWEEPAADWIRSANRDDLIDACDFMRVEYAEDALDETIRASLLAECEDDEDQSRELCQYVREDAQTIEAYEHWIVSNWLARKLEEQGEMVAHDLLGMTIWGRATTGQSISMDHVILTIANDVLKVAS